jgi:N-acetylglucosaminyldiphosphoundecaprenol N-acetyl-beta-D-mannosaminyltransferase
MDQENGRLIKKIISLNIDLVKYREALDIILKKGRERTPGYVCFANVHMIIEAHKNHDFAAQVNRATLVLADGMPIVNALSSLHRWDQERIAGMDVFPDLIRSSAVDNLKVFFFGTSNEMLEKIRMRAQTEFPSLKIAGALSPPFNQSLDDGRYIDEINSSGAHLVFVALGCPKQEKWMATHSPRIRAMLLGVGGAFPIYAGTSKRAPLWLRNLSLEWIYRLSQEPTRLFKRYFITNTLFLYHIIRLKVLNPAEARFTHSSTKKVN